MAVISITLRCTPPSTTAQQKRVRVINGRPQFFHSAEMRREESTWTSLLRPHQPAEPMDGPLSLSIRMVYPYLKATSKAHIGRLLPKTTRPDVGNSTKAIEDQLTRLRFITDDSRICRLLVEKFHGPEPMVGIQIQIATFVP